MASKKSHFFCMKIKLHAIGESVIKIPPKPKVHGLHLVEQRKGNMRLFSRCAKSERQSQKKHKCRDLLLSQRFVSTGRGRDPLQDEDHSGSRPHSFPGYYLMRSGWAPEWLRSTPVTTGSSESHQVVLMHQECGFLFY